MTTVRRKVQLVGGSTLSISLPKNWASAMGVNSGDELDIDAEPDGTLTLRPHRVGNATAQRHRLDVRNLDGAQVERRVLALYINGMDLIEVFCETGLPPDVVTSLEQLVRRTSGLEIVDQSSGRIVLQDMLDSRDIDIPRAFQRVYGIASGMHRDILGALAEGQPDRLLAVQARRQDVDRLAWVATRQVRVALRVRTPDTDQWCASRDTLAFASGIALAQRLGQYATNLAAAARKVVGKPADARLVPGLVELGTSALYLCDVAARALYTAEPKAADEAFTKAALFEPRREELQHFAAACSLKGGTCQPCFGTVQVLEWLHGSVIVAMRLAELAVQRAFTQDELPRASSLSPNGHPPLTYVAPHRATDSSEGRGKAFGAGGTNGASV